MIVQCRTEVSVAGRPLTEWMMPTVSTVYCSGQRGCGCALLSAQRAKERKDTPQWRCHKARLQLELMRLCKAGSAYMPAPSVKGHCSAHSERQWWAAHRRGTPLSSAQSVYVYEWGLEGVCLDPFLKTSVLQHNRPSKTYTISHIWSSV